MSNLIAPIPRIVTSTAIGLPPKASLTAPSVEPKSNPFSVRYSGSAISGPRSRLGSAASA